MNLLGKLKSFCGIDQQSAPAVANPGVGPRAVGTQPAQTGGHSAYVLPFPGRERAGGAVMDSAPAQARFKGMLNAPELESFFAENFFGLGRHNGAHLRTLDALDQGKRTLVARFQLITCELVERKRAYIKRLDSEALRVEGISAPVTAQLRLAVQQLERDIAILDEQAKAAAEERGWASPALELYRKGFLKGIQEALDFDLLGQQ